MKKPEPATAQICQSKPLLSMSLQICLRLLVLDYGGRQYVSLVQLWCIDCIGLYGSVFFPLRTLVIALDFRL